MKTTITIVTYCCLLFLNFGGLPATSQASSRTTTPQDDVKTYTRIGQSMPDFKIETLDGTRVSVADLKGKVLLVTFWATWCGPCQEEMPRLEKEIWQKFKSDDFVMVAIAREQSSEEISSYRDAMGLSFPMATDSDRGVFKLFANAGIPRLYLVGRDGKILFQSVGYIRRDFTKVKKLIASELAKA